jgi:hypothetical protein
MNPVETEKGVRYIRFNGIRIGNTNDAVGGLQIQFMFNGAAVAWERLQGGRLDTIRHLSTSHMEGRLRVE